MAEVFNRAATTVLAATNTLLGTACPSGKSRVISSINACNRGATAQTIRIAHVPGAIATVANKDYILYDYPIEPYGAVQVTIGITMVETDEILVRSDSANVSFQMWYSEIT